MSNDLLPADEPDFEGDQSDDELPSPDIIQRELRSAGYYLKPWMRKYAKWFALTKSHRDTQRAKLKELTGYEWTESDRRELNLHPKMRRYIKIWKEATLPAAREYLAELALPMARKLNWASKQAVKQNDYRAIQPMAAEVFKRTLELHGGAVQATQVNIVLSPQQMAALNAQPIEITATKVDDELPDTLAP